MIFFYILLVIIAILNLKLFFKVWGMCDNVAKITDKLCCMGENTKITNTICNSDAATETLEQITEQNSPTISSGTNKTYNINPRIVIIAYVLCAIIYLIFMIMKTMNNP